MASSRWLQALACSLLAGFAPLHRLILNPNLAILERDQLLIWTPAKFFLAKALREDGAIPLWNHLSEAGMPFWADVNGSPLFPLNFLFLLFESPTQGMTAYLFSLLALSYLGAYLLFRTLRVPANLALLAGFLLPWAGVSLSSLNLIHSLTGQAMTPWYLAFLLRWVRRRSAADAVLASLFLALPVYGSDPQTSYVLGWITAGVVAWDYAWTRRWKTILGAAAIGLGGFACAAAQMLPSIDMAIQRTGGLRTVLESEALFWSTHPWRLLELLVPYFWGSNVPRSSEFWGYVITEHNLGDPYLKTLFLGSLAGFSLLFLLPLSKNLRRKWRGGLLLSAVALGFLVAFGQKGPLPLYEAFFHALPGWNLFRYPERMVFWPILGLLLLAGTNLRRVLWILPRMSWTRTLLIGFVPTALALGGWAVWISSVPEAKPVVMPGIVGASILVVVKILLRNKWRGGTLFLVGVCLFLETAIHSHRVFHADRSEILKTENLPMVEKILHALEREPDDGRARRIHNMHEIHHLYAEKLREHLSENELRGHMAAMGLSGNTSLFWEIARVSSYNAVEPIRRASFWHTFSQEDPMRLLNLLSVRIIFSLDRMEKDKPGKYLFLLNDQALPEVFFPGSVFIAGSGQAVMHRIREMNVQREAVVLDPESKALWPGSQEKPPRVLSLRRHGRGLTVEFKAEKDSPLRTVLWNASWDRNWRAYVDGAPVPLAPANGWAMAAQLPPLPAGKTLRLEILYESPWVRTGVLLSGLWALLSGLVLGRCRKTSPRVP